MTISDARKRIESGEANALVCTICGHTGTDVHFETEVLQAACDNVAACRARTVLATEEPRSEPLAIANHQRRSPRPPPGPHAFFQKVFKQLD